MRQQRRAKFEKSSDTGTQGWTASATKFRQRRWKSPHLCACLMAQLRQESPRVQELSPQHVFSLSQSRKFVFGVMPSPLSPHSPEAFTRKGTQLSHHELWTFTTTRTETERKRARGTSKRSRTKSSIKNTDSFPEYDFKCTLAFSELTTKRKRVLNPGR